MQLETLKQTAISLTEAIQYIKSNEKSEYKWFAVKNKKKALLEVGGNNNNNKLVIKAYIPKILGNKYITHSNGFIDSEFSINSDGWLEYPSFRVFVSEEWDIKKMIDFLENTNFKKYFPKLTSYQRVKEYETIYKLQSL